MAEASPNAGLSSRDALLAAVEDCLMRADLENLILTGAPEWEYSVEAADVTTLLVFAQSEVDVTAILHEVFRHNFGETIDTKYYVDIAQGI